MNKTIGIIIAAVVTVAAIVAILVFALAGGKDDTSSGTSGGETANTLQLKGTWKVVAQVAGKAVTLPEAEFMVFGEDKVDYYSGGEVIANSAYELDSAMTLKLPDMSRTFSVAYNSDNQISLYESPDTYRELTRYPADDMSEVAVEEITGRWDVAYRKGMPDANEYLVFENGKMADYRSGSEEPAMELEYVWKDGAVVVESMKNKTWVASAIGKDVVALIETDTGVVWELHKHG